MRVGDGGDEGHYSEMEDGDDLSRDLPAGGFALRTAAHYCGEAGDRTIRRGRLISEKQMIRGDRAGHLSIGVGRIERKAIKLRGFRDGRLLSLRNGLVVRGHLFRGQKGNGILCGRSLRYRGGALGASELRHGQHRERDERCSASWPRSDSRLMRHESLTQERQPCGCLSQ